MAASTSLKLSSPSATTASWLRQRPLSADSGIISLSLRHHSDQPRRFVVLSMDRKPTILVSEKLGEAELNLLKEFANVDCSYNLSHKELCTRISLCDALIVGSGTEVNRDVFDSSGGRLKVVGRVGVGIDNVNLAAATQHGCLVLNAPPSANSVAVAEHAIALLTVMARNVAEAHASVKTGIWERDGVSLVGKTLAAIGFGKVGIEVARRAKGLGMHVIAHDPYAPADRARVLGVDLVSFSEAISRADFISLHAPLTVSTSKVLDDEVFAKMKRGVGIISLGCCLIDEDALVKAIDAGIVAQAKVFTVEPHLGESTTEAQEGVATEIVDVVRALKGELPTTVVNAPTVSAQVLTELRPYLALAEKLGRVACQLVKGRNRVKVVKVTYASARAAGDLDTRLLRAMITKGLIEPNWSDFVNLVNADFRVKQRGLRITEERIILDGSPESPLESVQVQMAKVISKFDSAYSDHREITVEGRVKDGIPHLIKVGSFEVDVSLEGSLILCRQVDQPGVIGEVGSILGDENVNVNSMSVGRKARGKQALMAMGVDQEPSEQLLKLIGGISAVDEYIHLKL